MSDPMHRRLLDSIYTEAMVLADEARSYFEEVGRDGLDGLHPLLRVGLSCESLKITTRLMFVIAWLLNRRAVDAGELSIDDARSPERRLGAAPLSDQDVLAAMPTSAVRLIVRSEELHRRAAVLDDALSEGRVAPSGVKLLQDRLAAML